ncbi:MAG: ATP-binding protein [Chthoniobacteraceae bacterium]
MNAELDRHPDVSQLKGNRLFSGLSADVINEIGSDVRLMRFAKDEVIFKEGEPGDCLYLVVDGAVRISKSGRGGHQETLGFILPGNFFGEMALIDGEPRSAQATAAEGTLLGHMNAASFERILENAPRDLHRNFLRSVVERLRGLNSHFINEIMRTERLSTVGTMANSIIHDLKNPIGAIQTCVELIAQRHDDSVTKQLVEILDKSVQNMTGMVQELLDFARGQSSLQFCRRAAAEVMQELDSELVRLIPQTVHLVRDVQFCDDVRVDVGRFIRVILNLVKNSVEAMPRGGVLRLELLQVENEAIFRVADTGTGIPADLMPKIFEPFVTHGKSKGTGLGMAIVKSVVDAHGGTIDIRSKVGVGTTVEIALPTLNPDKM